MILNDSPGVIEIMRTIFKKNRPYNAMSFKEFMDAVNSVKNMVTRYNNNNLCAGEIALINNIICISNYIGTDTSKVFETPSFIESHYAITRPILDYLNLPYKPGKFDERMQKFLENSTSFKKE